MEIVKNNKWPKISAGNVIRAYLIAFLVIMVFYCTYAKPHTVGEWDDYCLPTISIINEGNFSISPSDVQKAKEIYSDWAEYFDYYKLSGARTRKGGEMSWYFPTYSAALVPFTLLFYKMGVPAIYAFPFTNLTVLMIMALVIWKCLKAGEWRKLALIVLLTANPIVFYLSWASAEAFIFAMIGISLVFWNNHQWKRAAVFLSVAGTLNATIMAMGFFMIAEYFVCTLRNQNYGNAISSRFKYTFKNTVLFALCFVICLIPMAYNYYNVGHLNLTASAGFASTDLKALLGRFFAYLFDLNFGMLPYYWIVFIMAIVLIPFAFIKRQWRYLMYIVAGICAMLGYSIMGHINCGMSGIARYNSWASMVMVFAVCCYADKMFGGLLSKRVVGSLLAASSIITCIVVYNYGPVYASKTWYTKMTPIAAWFLDNYPQFYNPLHSTFNSRINNVDGGYTYETPIAYITSDNLVKKILAKPEDKDRLLTSYYGNGEDEEWFIGKVNELKSETYISIPKSKSIEKLGSIELDNPVLFYGEDYNADKFIKRGIYGKEEGFSWSGNDAELMIHIEGIQGKEIKGSIVVKKVFNERQKVQVLVNDIEVYNSEIASYQEKPIDISFTPESDIIDIRLVFPDAVSPADVGESGDTRVLGMQLTQIVFTEE